jgi:N-methylhydantoinase B
MTTPHAPDAIAFELFRNAIVALADEMSLTIYRASYSGVLKNIMDYSTALCDAEGRLVAQGLSLPGHLCSIPVALQASLAHFGGDIAEGDVLTMNDPFSGGMHLPDIFVFRPLFHQGRIVAIAATICHHTDVGGRVAGSNASDSTEIYQEGLRIPPLKLSERGVPNATLLALIEKNVRVPDRVMGDLRAQLAACAIAERGMAELVSAHGADAVIALMRAVTDHTERLTRAALADLPDGEASFEDWIDDDQIDAGRPIRLLCRVAKRGDRMVMDWTGSSPQVKGAINNTLSYTRGASFTAAKCVLPPELPNNDGVFRVVDVIAPPGTIANAVLPAACAARGLTGFRMVDCAMGALAMLYPDRVYAASDGGNTGITIGGWTEDRRPFIYVDFLSGAWGGRPWADGLDGNTNMFANMASHSAEVIEAEQPLEVLCNEFVPDTGGPGRFRGGVSIRRDWRFLEHEAVLQVRADRRTHRPYGLWGGEPGTPSLNALDPGTDAEQVLPAKLTMTIRKGAVFRHELPGAGGWGDPLARDPDAVREDVAQGFVTEAAAARDYGVVLAAGRVDAEATATLRKRLVAERGWAEPPAVSWQPWREIGRVSGRESGR